jgi:transcriptional regulator with XRE-family HTH domain
MEVHEKIRFLRESKDWSQEDMAGKLNMSVSGYSKIERGETKVAISKLKKVADIFGIDVIELMTLGEKHVYLISENSNNGCNIIGSPVELAFENQKQKLIIELKDKELAMQQREIENLKVQITQLQKINGLLEKNS